MIRAMRLFHRGPKDYRIVRDERGGGRFPWTVYGPGGAGEPLDMYELGPSDVREMRAAAREEKPWLRTWDRGDEQLVDVFRTKREARHTIWVLENMPATVDPNAPLCWRVSVDV
jgi:hypothetical protein